MLIAFDDWEEPCDLTYKKKWRIRWSYPSRGWRCSVPRRTFQRRRRRRRRRRWNGGAELSRAETCSGGSWPNQLSDFDWWPLSRKPFVSQHFVRDFGNSEAGKSTMLWSWSKKENPKTGRSVNIINRIVGTETNLKKILNTWYRWNRGHLRCMML